MKIEMGESLAASWLRHVYGCRVVQTNWKPSPRWEEKNYTEIKELVDEAREKFGELNVFKKNTDVAQVLHQTECDVIGLKKTEGGDLWHIVEVAFHENGVQYGNKYETAVKIAGKLFRSAIGLLCYMNVREGIINFVTPKATRSYLRQIRPAVELVSSFFDRKGYAFRFGFFANEQFRDEVMNPVVALADEISDTSELFLRSLQMKLLFEHANNAVVREGEKLPIHVEDGGENVRVGRLANVVMRRILENLDSDEEVIDLLDADYSREAFGLNYPVLKIVDGQEHGQRYYANPVTICGVRYWLCNDWYDRNRGRLEGWIAGHE